MTWLDGKKLRNASYMKVLSQHSTQKPKREGGAPNPGGVLPLCEMEDYHGGIAVRIPLPNSFNPNDGLAIESAGWGADLEAAREAAARLLVAKLLCQGPHQVRLLDQDWPGGSKTSEGKLQPEFTMQASSQQHPCQASQWGSGGLATRNPVFRRTGRLQELR